MDEYDHYQKLKTGLNGPYSRQSVRLTIRVKSVLSERLHSEKIDNVKVQVNWTYSFRDLVISQSRLRKKVVTKSEPANTILQKEAPNPEVGDYTSSTSIRSRHRSSVLQWNDDCQPFEGVGFEH
ncbi:hypothetical protein EVAR_47185_1 [Eumeta japonica]|uniref:Uncharacterized protein n=1 Tax=Eumeta variegata TaxID=151549 RepID=A0A4C1WVM5_EUMVA|nr:hypothetical protein EVAR_47185_1 [Eumeta japonica]